MTVSQAIDNLGGVEVFGADVHSEIEFVERMPTTISGKIRRVVIRQESERRADGGPRTGDAARQ